MRTSYYFKTKSLPHSYRAAMISLVKEALRKENEKYYRRLSENGAVIKPFCFSVYLNNFKKQGEGLELDGFWINFSSPDCVFMLTLQGGMSRIKNFGSWEKIESRVYEKRKVQRAPVLFKTLSPVYLDGLQPEDSGFEDKVNRVAHSILRSFRGQGLRQKMNVETIKTKKHVVKQGYQGLQELYLSSFRGEIILDGDPEDLDLLYSLGLSRRRSQGFGMLEVV